MAVSVTVGPGLRFVADYKHEPVGEKTEHLFFIGPDTTEAKDARFWLEGGYHVFSGSFLGKGSRLAQVLAMNCHGVALAPGWENSPEAIRQALFTCAAGLPLQTVGEWML